MIEIVVRWFYEIWLYLRSPSLRRRGLKYRFRRTPGHAAQVVVPATALIEVVAEWNNFEKNLLNRKRRGENTLRLFFWYLYQ